MYAASFADSRSLGCPSLLYTYTFALHRNDTGSLLQGSVMLVAQSTLSIVATQIATLSTCQLVGGGAGSLEFTTSVRCTGVRIPAAFSGTLFTLRVVYSATAASQTWSVRSIARAVEQGPPNSLCTLGVPVQGTNTLASVNMCAAPTASPTPAPAGQPSSTPTPAPTSPRAVGACCGFTTCYDNVAGRDHCALMPFAVEFVGANTSCLDIVSGAASASCSIAEFGGCCQFPPGAIGNTETYNVTSCTSSLNQASCESLGGTFGGAGQMCAPGTNGECIAGPTPAPTVSPTTSPSMSPTRMPTEYPTKEPTLHPTEYPTKMPTPHPTPRPTEYLGPVGMCCSATVAQCYDNITETRCSQALPADTIFITDSDASCMGNGVAYGCVHSPTTELDQGMCCEIVGESPLSYPMGRVCTTSLYETPEDGVRCRFLWDGTIQTGRKMCNHVSRRCRDPCTCGGSDGDFEVGLLFSPDSVYKLCTGNDTFYSVPFKLQFRDNRDIGCQRLSMSGAVLLSYTLGTVTTGGHIRLDAIAAQNGGTTTGELVTCTPLNAHPSGGYNGISVIAENMVLKDSTRNQWRDLCTADIQATLPDSVPDGDLLTTTVSVTQTSGGSSCGYDTAISHSASLSKDMGYEDCGSP